MAAASDTVRGRLEHVGTTLTPLQIAAAIGVVAVLGTVLLFAQDPTLHHALHDFRHVAGVTCH